MTNHQSASIMIFKMFCAALCDLKSSRLQASIIYIDISELFITPALYKKWSSMLNFRFVAKD